MQSTPQARDTARDRRYSLQKHKRGTSSHTAGRPVVDAMDAAGSDHDSDSESNTLGGSRFDEKDALQAQKLDDIRAACEARDVIKLQALAGSSGGFVTDALRKSAWPILLGIPPPTTDSNDEPLPSAAVAEGDWKKLPHHGDEEQVQLDVNRSFVYYPHNLSDAALEERRSQLSNLITEVLRRCPFLCYFQGFHDICQVLLLVLQPAWAAPCVARLSVLRIRDFMLPNLGPTTAQLRLLPDVLGKADPELRRHVASIEPFYALAGTLTMYAHNIEAYHDIARLFDILLAREPVFSIYMFAQIVIDRRDEIFDIDEPDLLQVVLARVPPKMDLDALIERSAALFKRFPPETLRSWRRISKASALKTARDGQDAAKQTLEQGEEYFETQAKELRWIDLRDKMAMVVWRYRRPARAVGMAVAVSLVAFYIRRNPTMMHHIMSFFSK